MVAQTGQNPALNYQHGILCLGFILGFIGSRRHHRDQVVFRPLLITWVEVRVVAAGFADTAAQTPQDVVAASDASPSSSDFVITRPDPIDQPATESTIEEESAAPPQEEVVAVQTPAPAPAPVPTPTPAPVDEAGPIYAWIVASSPSEAEAQAHVDGLTESGFDARIYRATVRGALAFRVGVGQFASEIDALNNRALVPEAEGAWVTKVK